MCVAIVQNASGTGDPNSILSYWNILHCITQLFNNFLHEINYSNPEWIFSHWILFLSMVSSKKVAQAVAVYMHHTNKKSMETVKIAKYFDHTNSWVYFILKDYDKKKRKPSSCAEKRTQTENHRETEWRHHRVFQAESMNLTACSGSRAYLKN